MAVKNEIVVAADLVDKHEGPLMDKDMPLQDFVSQVGLINLVRAGG